MFTEADRDLILSIPISQGNHADKMIWSPEEKGIYSVKSGYRHLMGEFQNTHIICWSALWNLPIPPKERNNRTWNSTKSTELFILEEAKGYLAAWQSCQATNTFPGISPPPIKWTKPPCRWLKINTDAALDHNFKSTGFGIVIRDSNGSFMAAKFVKRSANSVDNSLARDAVFNAGLLLAEAVE
nr:Polynucleotidyl transferase, Ribonuclease H fold [Ipomoea batatas]